MPRRVTQGLTAAFCRSARPRTGADGTPARTQAEYPDLDVRGLSLRVSPGGQKSWTFRYRDQLTGKQARVTLGAYDPTADGPPDENGVRRLTLHGARVAARLLRAQVDAGRNPALEIRRKRETARTQEIKTVGDLARAYFEACESGAHRGGRRRKKAASTLAGERWMWGRYIERRLGREPVETVSRAQVRALLREVLGQAPGQCNKVRALLSQMFNFAVAEERLTVNPVAHVPAMAEDRARTRTLTDPELRAVWGGLQDISGLSLRRAGRAEKVMIGRPVRIAIELAMFTLQRRAEIAGMRRSEVDLERRAWVIPADRTKGRAEHLAPLPERAVALIREALALQARRERGESPFVFPARGAADAPMDPGALSHAMADLTRALGLDDVTLHDLRRTGATGMAALGVPPFVVSKVLAHRDAGGGAAITARHYNLYLYEAEKRDALDRWAARLEALLGLPAERTCGAPS